MPHRLLLFCALLLSWMLGSPAHESQALPQFPARFGLEIHTAHEEGRPAERTLDCRACHINPTGGGMRNAHGRRFASQFLRWSSKAEEHEHGPPARHQDTEEGTILGGLGRVITIGSDLRFAYLRAQEESTSRFKDTFFPMQADLYLAMDPTDHLTILLQEGLGGPREFFGLLHRFPYNLHLKFGRFVPPYGLKLDDHRSFIRDALLLGVQHQDVGIETGFATYPYFLNLAVFNGARGSSADDNRSKGVSTTGGVKYHAVTLAGSYYFNDGLSERREYYGVYATGRYWKLTWLGEWDRTRVADRTSGGQAMEGTAVYHELDFMIHPGAIIKVEYDFLDPDRTIQDDDRQRLTFGVDLYLYPSTELTIQYWRNIEKPDLDDDRALAIIHLYF